MTTGEQAGVLYCIPPCCLICEFGYATTLGGWCGVGGKARGCDETCGDFTLRYFGQEIKTVEV